MMYPTTFPYLHAYPCLLLLLGIAFFIIYAIKHFSQRQLLIWTIILLILGALGSLVTLPYAFHMPYGVDQFHGQERVSTASGETLSPQNWEEAHDVMHQYMWGTRDDANTQ